MEDINITECGTEPVLKSNEFFRYVLIPAVLISIGLSFQKSRKNLCLNFLSGSPGLLYPWNCVEAQKDRLGIVAFHVFSAACVIELIKGNLVIFEIPELDHSTRVIINAFFLGVAFYPIVSLLTYGQTWGLLIGCFYMCSFTVCYFLILKLPCHEELEFHLTAKLPFYLCLLYLVLIFPYKLLRKMYLHHYVVTDQDFSPQVSYIKHILRKSKQNKESHVKIPRYQKVMNWLDNKRYHSIPGFRFSPRLLSCVAVGVVIVHQITMLFSSLFVIQLLPMCNPKEYDFLKQIIDTGVLHLFFPNMSLSTFVIDYIKFQCTSIIGISIFTVIFCELLFLILCLHFLCTYRDNVLCIYRGNYENIPRFANAKPVKIIIGFIKFAGFQTAAFTWGYSIQVIVIWILLILLLELIIAPIKFGYADFLFNFLLYIIPIMISAFLTILLEHLFTRIVFLHKKRLNNRRMFFNYVYFTYYFNIIKGIVSTLVRLVKAIVFGIWFLPRLDTSCLSRRFENHDSGFVAYVNFLKMENQHTNPILLVFVHHLCQSTQQKKLSRITDEKRSRICRRWYLAFTLLHNPGLIPKRKTCVIKKINTIRK